MPLERLQLINFRSFQDKSFKFSSGTNLILGENGSGKTSVLEALNILLTGNSFRAKETKECINSHKDFYNISLIGKLRDKNLKLKVQNSLISRPSSKRTLDDLSVKKEELYFFQLVLAKNLKMIEGEPDLRREFFNELMFHVKPQTKKIHNQYQRALKQRNKCLKNKLSNSEISLWSKEVSSLGLELSLEQYDFFKIFKKEVIKHIEEVVSSGVFAFLDEVDVAFTKGWERTKKLDDSLTECLERDRAVGYTSKGPHRMDFTFKVKKKHASSNLSRGQLKILILLIFLSSSMMIKSLTNREIILLMDDLGAELDYRNLSSILQQILKTDSQIIFTGIEGEEMHKSVAKLTNFTKINL